jgi:hypothetical protein
MKSKRAIKVGTATVFAVISLVSTKTRAAIVDFTINDGRPKAYYGIGGDPRPGIDETKSTTENSTANNDWDLKFLAFDTVNNQLILGGGFNPLEEKDGYSIGDIFFETNGVLSQPFHQTGNSSVTYDNPGYEFCINIKASSLIYNTLTFDLVQMSSSSKVISNAVQQNWFMNPWSISASSTDVVLSANNTAEVKLMSDSDIMSTLGINIGNGTSATNYVAFFNLPSSFLPPNTTTKVFTALECGNDAILGSFETSSLSLSAVPEPGNCLGTATLICLGSLIRFRGRIKK